MPKLIIDGKEFNVKAGKNLLETVLSLGFDLPYFCWHPAMGSVGSCRQCAIKKYKDEDDEQGMVAMSCMEPVKDGLRISLKDDESHDFRKNVIEWLMSNHPHDCPVCDEGGECHLQDMTVMAGHAYRRFRYKKRTYTNQDLGPCINHEMNRCIQCYRCVRFYQDYAGGDDLQVFASHNHVYFGRHQDGTLESEFSGNLVEVCPTGVFTDKTLKQHYTRKWDMTSAPSICQHCSLGCNTIASERYGSLRRIQSRYNGDVNGYFICDRGRFGYEFVNADERIRTIRPKSETSEKEAIEKVASWVKSGKTLAIGSPRASLESNFALQQLVGNENFFLGISKKELELNRLVNRILKDGNVKTPSLAEIESCDAVIVIGEDVTQTAPMIDLALRQAILQQPRQKAKKLDIPEWNDAAIRELIQNERGPLYILTPQLTKMDRQATAKYRLSSEQIADSIQALAQEVDNEIPGKHSSPIAKKALAEMGDALMQSEKPLVICGTSLQSEDLIKSASNLAHALKKKNTNTRLSFVLQECNSMGTAMLAEKSIEETVPDADHLIVMESDLSLYLPDWSELIDRFEQVACLDHSETSTSKRAELVFPSATFAESSGTLINNEGRAQRYFQVQATKDEIRSSWEWILSIGQAAGMQQMKNWDNLDTILHDMETEHPALVGIKGAAPPADYRINGQRIPRQSHRYSGRTAMHAADQVNEPQTPEDRDSSLSYSMEGSAKMPPGAQTPFFWSPGWNSEQAINKFQIEVGGDLHQGNPGKRLIEPITQPFDYFEMGNKATGDGFRTIPVHQIFGSEEMSYRAPAIQARSKGPFAILSTKDLEDLSPGDAVNLSAENWKVILPVRKDETWPKGTVGISWGFPFSGRNIPDFVTIKPVDHGT